MENFRHFIIMPESQKRQIAYKIRIRDILEGNYIKEEGWQPNYVLTRDRKEISRINLIGIVVDKQTEFNREFIIVDDGSGRISIKTFNDNIRLDNEIGDVIMIIGRPREYNNEKYIMPEIIKKIRNKKWIDLRKLELNEQDVNFKIDKNRIIKKEEVKKEMLPSEIVFNLIKELDSGEGANFDEIINKAGTEAEKIISNLLTEGEIFQNKPGRLKVLN